MTNTENTRSKLDLKNLLMFGDPVSMYVEFRSKLFETFGMCATSARIFDADDSGAQLEVTCVLTTTTVSEFMALVLDKAKRQDLFEQDALPTLVFSDFSGKDHAKLNLSANLQNYEAFTDYSVSPGGRGFSRKPDRDADQLYASLDDAPDDTHTMKLDKSAVRWLMRQSAEVRDMLVNIANGLHDKSASPHLKLLFLVNGVEENAHE